MASWPALAAMDVLGGCSLSSHAYFYPPPVSLRRSCWLLVIDLAGATFLLGSALRPCSGYAVVIGLAIGAARC